jgi:protein-S-isoprenylcysteine O-methyltransferase Ste14
MNKILWGIVIFLFIGLMFEYAARQHNEEKIQERVEKDYREYCTIGARLIETTPARNEIMQSCFVGGKTR